MDLPPGCKETVHVIDVDSAAAGPLERECAPDLPVPPHGLAALVQMRRVPASALARQWCWHRQHAPAETKRGPAGLVGGQHADAVPARWQPAGVEDTAGWQEFPGPIIDAELSDDRAFSSVVMRGIELEVFLRGRGACFGEAVDELADGPAAERVTRHPAC